MLNMKYLLRQKSSLRCIITCLIISFILSGCGYLRRAQPLKISPDLYSTLSKVETVRITGPGSNLSGFIIKKLKAADIAIVWQSKAKADLTIKFEVTQSIKPGSFYYAPKGSFNNSSPKKWLYHVTIFAIVTVYDRKNRLICRDKIICKPSLPESAPKKILQKDIYIMANNKFKKIFERGYVAKLIDILVANRIKDKGADLETN